MPQGRSPTRLVVERVLGSDPVVRAMVLALPLVKLLGVVSVSPTTYPDTRTYRHVDHWFDFSLTSLDGRSIRPVGVTAWMALWPNDRVIVLAQALLSAVAWGALALVVAQGIRRPGPRRLFAAMLVLIPCSAQIANWDTVILGDSVAMTTGILALAAVVQLTREPTWGHGLVFLAAALWYTMTRPNLFVVLLAWALGLALIAALTKKLILFGAVAAILVLLSGYSYVYNMRADPTWSQTFGYSRSTVGMAYPLGIHDPVASRVIADLRRSDAPSCMIPASPAVVTRPGPTRWAGRTSAACPGMDAWATAHWQRWWAGWLLTHPTDTMRIIDSQLPHSLAPSIWGEVIAATPPGVASLFLGTPAMRQDAHANRTYHVQPLILWAAIAAILAILAATRRLWRGTSWGADVILAATVAGGLASAISSGLLIQTTPHEVAQESLGASAVIIAALVAAVALGWDRVFGGALPAEIARPAATARTPGIDPPVV